MLFSGDPTTIEPDLAIKQEIPVRSERSSHSENTTEQSLEDLSLEGQDILNVLDGACNKRTAQSIWRHMADLQVRQREQNLKTLQQGLQDLDNDLLETDNCIRRLRCLAQQQVFMPLVIDTGMGKPAGFTRV